MMKFKRSREEKLFDSTWDKIIHSSARANDLHSIKLCGPCGSGKTFFVQELARTQRGIYYMSFEGMTAEEALQKFARLYLPDGTVVSTWEDAGKAFTTLRHHRKTLLVFEDETEECQRECKKAFLPYTRRKGLFRICEIKQSCSRKDEYCVPISFFSISDFCDNLSLYSRADVMRLHALTGGIPAVAKELDAEKSFEENVRQLLSYDSAFSLYLPERMRIYFRAPESYYPLLRSMAFGRHRLSEIAKDVGFPNNKCGKYLDALIDVGFVIAEHDGGPYAKYDLSNTYYTAWCRYAYLHTTEQIIQQEEHLQYVLSDLDEAIALPAFQNACLRFIGDGEKTSKVFQRTIPVKMPDGSSVIMKGHEEPWTRTWIYVIPQSLTIRFTKIELQKILAAAKKYDPFVDAEVTIFGLERFSDWCVHESAKNEYLHEVTMDRLRY